MIEWCTANVPIRYVAALYHCRFARDIGNLHWG